MSRGKGLFVGLLFAGILVCAGALPLTTRQGVNYQVSVHQIPLFVKGLEFILRDIQLAHLAAEITLGIQGEEDRAKALFKWTRERIHHTPPGLPVIDDHIAHIIIRGYGEADQMADVFTTLSTYAGLPAFWKASHPKSRECNLILSFVRINGRWTVWDVANGSKDMDLEENGSLEIPETLRAEKQMLGPRISFEIRKEWRSMWGRLIRKNLGVLTHGGAR